MARLTSYRGGGITSVDLNGTWWRLQVAAIPSIRGAGFALVFRYPTAMPVAANGAGWLSMSEYAQLALAVADVDFAEGVNALKPVADVGLIGGNQEADIARTTEAMNLFRNMPRLKEEALAGALRDVTAVIEGYWKILAWHRAGAAERMEIQIADAVVVGVP